MVHHPLILGPKLVVLAAIIIVLVILHGSLPPDQFRIAVVIAIFVFVVSTVLIWVVAIRMMSNPNSKMGQATILSHEQRVEDGFAAPSPETEVAVGARGKAASGLRPSGVAVLEGKRVGVVTNGEFIDSGASVEVVETTGYRVVVKELDE